MDKEKIEALKRRAQEEPDETNEPEELEPEDPPEEEEQEEMEADEPVNEDEQSNENTRDGMEDEEEPEGARQHDSQDEDFEEERPTKRAKIPTLYERRSYNPDFEYTGPTQSQ